MTLNEMAAERFREYRAAGWQNDNLGELIALIHSELSEMLQAERTGERDKHLPHRMAAEVECADALTRLLIYAGFRGFDLDGVVAEKRAYNAEREDHKPENRRKEGGKAF
jgi:NTP pyrophosphatase (non-canonical NTP hydrolase)